MHGPRLSRVTAALGAFKNCSGIHQLHWRCRWLMELLPFMATEASCLFMFNVKVDARTTMLPDRLAITPVDKYTVTASVEFV